MRPRRPATVLSLVLLVLLLWVAGCGSDDTTDEADPADPDVPVDEGEPVDGGTLSFAVEGESDGYNPVAHRWSISGNLIGSSVYESLAVVDADGDVEPWLAESLEPNEDGTEWVVTAREGITFQDGSPFDAEVIAANLQARAEGALTAMANAPIASVEVLDEMTVRVTMNTPWRAWDHSVASQSGYMMSLTNVEDPGADPIGTGPFAWKDWVVDTRVVVERYDDYWREGLPHLDEIEFQIIVDEQAREQALRAGDVDAIITQTPSAIVDFLDSDFTVVEHTESDTHVVMLNTAAPPFDDPVAREALVLATDREALVDTLYDGEVEVAFGPLASERWRIEDSEFPDHDLERARELVEQYEEESGQAFAFTLSASAGQGNSDRMAVLAAQWSEAGIEATQEDLEQAAFIGQVVQGNYDAALFRNFGWADPDFNYLFWHSDNALGVGEISVNFTQTANPDLDAALELGRSSDDPDERHDAYQEVQRILNEELSYIWLYHSRWAIVSQPSVRGWAEAADRGWSRQDAKIFWADLWIEQ